MAEPSFEIRPALPLARSGGILSAAPTIAREQRAVADRRDVWGWRLTWAGRASLVLFAAIAVISANREAGLLTLGALAQINSAVRGGVQVGVAFLLLPAGTVLWVAGHWLLRRWPTGPRARRLGPLPVVAPLFILMAFTLAPPSLSICCAANLG